TVDAVALEYTVTNQGKLGWHVAATPIATADMEKGIHEVVAKLEWAGATAVVTCPAKPRVRISRAGDEIECRIRSGAVEGWALVHVKDDAGNVRLRMGRDGTEMGRWERGTWIRRALL